MWIRLLSGFVLVYFFSGSALPAGDMLIIRFTENSPVIDGRLEEAIWRTVDPIREFRTYKPDFGGEPADKTEVFIVCDRSSLYVAFRCLDSEPAKIKASISKRDGIVADDWICVALDTLNDQQNGYVFLVNPYGVQMDGIIDSEGNPDWNFDAVWKCQGKINGEGYIVEMAIPFKSLRFPQKQNIVSGAGFFRNIPRRSELSSFPGINPQNASLINQFQKIDLGTIKFERIVELIPAITVGQVESHQLGILTTDPVKTGISLTGKVGITSLLTLDGTVNPDFSQVEADAGQIDVNLRYAVFYPEKRPFFLEGLENFDFGARMDANPLEAVVNTRTIGDPVFGLKLNGKLTGRDVCAVILAMDENPGSSSSTEADTDISTGNAFFSIFRGKHLLKNDGFIGAFYTGRVLNGGYNRVLGIDGRIRLNKTSLLEYDFFRSLSRDHNQLDKTQGNAFSLRYYHNTRTWTIETGYIDVASDFRTDVGRLTRSGICMIPLLIQYSFFPKSRVFQKIQPYYYATYSIDRSCNLFETYNLFSVNVEMPRMTQLLFEGVMANEVFAGRRFNCNLLGFHFQSQFSKRASLSIIIHRGNGILYDLEDPSAGRTCTISLFLQLQPWEKLDTKLDASHSDFYRSPDSMKMYDYTILRNQTVYHINKHIYFRGIFEYNFFLKRFNADFLASFTYIPGTVLYLGYGSVYDKIRWNGTAYEQSDRFITSKRGFFIKASYLWRW